MPVGADEMQRMIVEIARGVIPEESVLAPLTEEQLEMWAQLAAEMAQIAARGNIVEIPTEQPSLRGYREGFAPGVRNIP
jgi:hypothetical protein